MVALGQFGSDYLAANQSVAATGDPTVDLPDGMDIIAIQFVGTNTTTNGTSLSTMTVASGSDCFTKTGTVFPDGLTVFGRWNAVTVTNTSDMAAVVYYGPKL